MHLGVYATLIAAALYTLNLDLTLIVVFVAAAHHKIVLAEEQHLRKVFGNGTQIVAIAGGAIF